jgi:hypothetical protein
VPDDLEIIPNASGLLRRVHPKHLVPAAEPGRRRLSSGAFRDPELSVDVEPMLQKDGHDWNYSLAGHAGHSLVRINAGFARQQNQSVEQTPEAANPYHAEIIGKKRDPVCRAFAAAAEWVSKPSDVD